METKEIQNEESPSLTEALLNFRKSVEQSVLEDLAVCVKEDAKLNKLQHNSWVIARYGNPLHATLRLREYRERVQKEQNAKRD